MDDMRICSVCKQEHKRNQMKFTKDCHGIPYRLTCLSCHEICMEGGYDVEYYDEQDEQIDPD